MSKIIGWFWKLISNLAQAWQLLAAFLPTSVVAAMTGYLATVENVPVYLGILYGLGALCLGTVSAMAFFQSRLRLTEWLYATTPQGKLDYLGPHIGVEIDWDRNKARSIKKVNLGFQLPTARCFPLAIESSNTMRPSKARPPMRIN